MIMTISEARKLIGAGHVKYTDQEIEEIINTFSVLSDIAIDSWLTKTPEERKQFSRELTQIDKSRAKPSK